MQLQFHSAPNAGIAQIEPMLRRDAEYAQPMLAELKNSPEAFTAICADDELVGTVQIETNGDVSHLSVYIAPEHRRKGIGEAAVRYAEQRIGESGARVIKANYHADSDDVKRFVRRHGYNRTFSSAQMKRDAEGFPAEDWPVRGYLDEDYDEAHELYAQAFHRMRVSVGDFPDSVPAQPSERSRKVWSDDAANRFIYVHDGEIAGYAHLEDNELSSVAVRPDMQGRGIGNGLVRYLCNEIYRRGYDEVSLWCVVGNRARHLYDRLGFRELYIAECVEKRIDA